MTAAVAASAPRRVLSVRRSPADLAGVGLAALLSAAIIVLVLVQDRGTVMAAVLAVAMTTPVAYSRVVPTAAGLSLAAAAGVNEVFFGHLVRCGAALPAAFYVAAVAGYVLGRRARLAVAGATASIVVQCLWDPRLGPPVILLLVPLGLLFFGAGLYLNHRAAMSAALRTYADQLQEQRHQTALLAVEADRELLVAGLNETLSRHLGAIESAAMSAVDERDAFTAVERIGRETLDDMRALLGSLSGSPTSPEPGLADLADVCSRATTADVRLTVDGTVRPLPASIELSACRIVEQLLRAVGDQPRSRVLLTVDYDVAGLDIGLTGLLKGGVDVRHVEAVAATRASLHGGRVEIDDRGSERRARVWLPFGAVHA